MSTGQVGPISCVRKLRLAYKDRRKNSESRGLQSLKYCLFGPFQLLYPWPVTSFQLQALTSLVPSILHNCTEGLVL